MGLAVHATRSRNGGGHVRMLGIDQTPERAETRAPAMVRCGVPSPRGCGTIGATRSAREASPSGPVRGVAGGGRGSVLGPPRGSGRGRRSRAGYWKADARKERTMLGRFAVRSRRAARRHGRHMYIWRLSERFLSAPFPPELHIICWRRVRRDKSLGICLKTPIEKNRKGACTSLDPCCVRRRP